ncbi:MAG: sigma factor [Planctomycetota bacterium]
MGVEGSAGFHTTQWSLIAALPGGSGDREAARAAEALEHLCGAYWRPLYAFARRSGKSSEDAEDLTQAFLARLIETDGLGGADPDRGRFRSYLLGAMKHFMSAARQRSEAQKRGGGRRFLAVDIGEIESLLASSEARGTPADAELAFDRVWARETTAAALRALEAEWSERGRAEQFAVLRPVLSGDGPARTGLAAELGMTENAAGVAIHRVRQRYAALVREAVARTVSDEADIESEVRYLVDVLREN